MGVIEITSGKEDPPFYPDYKFVDEDLEE